MKLEELTKEELLLIIRNRIWLPSEKDMLNARWERLSKEAQNMMNQSIEESSKWTGKKDMESYRNWRDAQDVFTAAMKKYDEAEEIFRQMMETK